MQLKDLVDDVMRKIGRNMMLFQQLEYLLKFVVANGNLSGYSSELKDIKAKKAETVNKQTMGQLVGQFLENSDPDYQTFTNEPEVLKETYFSIRFSTETDSVSYAAKKAALADLVNQRNELIHHLLPKFDTTSQTSCEELSLQLDAQSEIIRKEIKEVQSIAKALNHDRKQLGSYLTSDECGQHIKLIFLKQSSLAISLVDIAEQLGKEGTWVSLSLAGQLVREHIPDELEGLRANHGYKTLKGFMLATELFEFKDEETSKGGVRVLYKLNESAKINSAEKADFK